MKNTLIAILVIIILVLGFFLVKGKNKPVVDNSWPETIPANPTNNNSAPQTTASNPNSTICSSSSPASITVLSPNGGEIYYKNEAFAFKWKSCNVPSTFHIGAEFVDVNNSSGGMALMCEGGSSSWTDVCLNDGDQMAHPAAGWTPGTYKLKLTVKEGGTVSDMSNAPFTIKAEDYPAHNFSESGNDVNGTHTGYIKSVSGSGSDYSLTVDYVILGVCPPIEPEDECLINNNSLIRTFPISNTANITVFDDSMQPVTVTSLQQFANNLSTEWGTSLNWIVLEGGVVTKIYPIYLP